MTATSLLPMAAQHAGISFDNLVEQIMRSARLKELNPARARRKAVASHAPHPQPARKTLFNGRP